MIKHIFFDFDGVLAESVNVKTEAFRQMYLSHGDAFAQRVVDHHLDNGGVSRFEKFKIYNGEWLGESVDDARIAELANQFSQLVMKGVIEAEEVPGSQAFLEAHAHEFNYWIITGTPTEEIKQILKARGMDQFFKEACGSPTKKYDWAQSLIAKNDLNVDEIVFVGDALADYEAADKSGIKFILRETAEALSLFEFFDGARVKDMNELYQSIQNC